VAAVPGGTDLRVKRILLWVARINFCSVGGSYSKLSEFGWRAGVSGFVVQMYTALIATLEWQQCLVGLIYTRRGYFCGWLESMFVVGEVIRNYRSLVGGQVCLGLWSRCILR